jgi:hypothetical protein
VTKKFLFIIALTAMSSVVVNAAPATCQAFESIAALKTYNNNPEPGCVAGDKIFTNFETNLPDALFVQRLLVETGGPTDLHGWLLLTFGLAPGTYNFEYTISVDTVNYPYKRMSVAQLDASGGTDATYAATKTINDGQYILSVSNVSAQDSTLILPYATALTIRDDFVFTGPLITLSNTFTQVSIPEPITMALVGSGFLALGLFRRFRRS